MDDNAAPLPTTLAECHAKIIELTESGARQQATIQEQQATIDEQQELLQALQRDIALMKRTLFGQRRERFEDPRQGTLFDAVAVGGSDQEDTSDAADLVQQNDTSSKTDNENSPPRNGRRRRVIPESLPSGETHS